MTIPGHTCDWVEQRGAIQQRLDSIHEDISGLRQDLKTVVADAKAENERKIVELKADAKADREKSEKDHDCSERKIADLRVSVGQLQVRAGIWAAVISGVITIIGGIVLAVVRG